jgi:hypothetical protein
MASEQRSARIRCTSLLLAGGTRQLLPDFADVFEHEYPNPLCGDSTHGLGTLTGPAVVFLFLSYFSAKKDRKNKKV